MWSGRNDGNILCNMYKKEITINYTLRGSFSCLGGGGQMVVVVAAEMAT